MESSPDAAMPLPRRDEDLFSISLEISISKCAAAVEYKTSEFAVEMEFSHERNFDELQILCKPESIGSLIKSLTGLRLTELQLLSAESLATIGKS